MKIVITGANGFVGQNLVPKLLKQGNELFEITIEPEKSKSLFGNRTKQFYYSQERHGELVAELTGFQPDICIHLASFLTAADDFETLHKLLNANIQFTCNVLDALKTSGVKLFINTGSFAEYYKGDNQLDPAYLYTATKSASRVFVDYYSKTYGFKYITIAPYTIYGGLDTQKKIIDIIYDSLDNETPLSLTPGNQILDFIHLEDVTDFYVEILNKYDNISSGTTFQLGTGVGHTLKDLVKIMERLTSKTANINWGGRDYRPRDVMYAVANISNQFHLFGWKAKISLDQGVRIYLEAKNSSK